MRALAMTLGIASVALCLGLEPTTLDAQSRSLAPYVPTPQDVVDRMLTLAKVGPRDVVFDLGCGDGRIVITAAQKFGALMHSARTASSCSVARLIASETVTPPGRSTAVARRFSGRKVRTTVMQITYGARG